MGRRADSIPQQLIGEYISILSDLKSMYMFWNKNKERIKELEHENERLKEFLHHVADTLPDGLHNRAYGELIKRVVKMEKMGYFKLKS